MPILAAIVLDVLVTVIFAAIGRHNHGESSAVVGVITTAWPFAVGALGGWLILLLTKRPAAGTRMSGGVVVWLTTVALGMLLRHFTDRGVVLSFVLVALAFNGLFILGWRALARLVERRKAATER